MENGRLRTRARDVGRAAKPSCVGCAVNSPLPWGDLLIRHRVGTQDRWMPRPQRGRAGRSGRGRLGSRELCFRVSEEGTQGCWREDRGLLGWGFSPSGGSRAQRVRGHQTHCTGCWGLPHPGPRAAQEAPCPLGKGPGPWLWLWEAASASTWRRSGSSDLTAPIIESASNSIWSAWPGATKVV